MRKAKLFLLLLVLTGPVAFGQNWTMPVDGKVFSSNGDKMSGAIITLFKNGQQMQQAVTTTNGRFSLELPPNAEYVISITKPGFITKKFKIITANVPPDRAEVGGFNPFEPDVTLFEMPTAPEISKRVEAILSQPIGIYQYIPGEQNFNYDEKYTNAMQSKLAELAQLQKQIEKEMEDKAKNAAMEAQKQLEIDKKYKAAIAKGDGALGTKDYSAAKNAYNEALTIKPGEAYPKGKLIEIDKLMADAGKQKEIDAKYQDAIKKADAAMGSKDYATAKTAYTEASGVKPSESYPKTRLAEIDKLLADAGKQKELDAKYQAAISKADAAFGAKDYAGAKVAYTEASGIKPAESHPKTRLSEIEKLLADANKQKEVDAKYQAAITKGDGAMNSKDYASAKTAYTEASGVKPSEAYPKTKLAEIDKLLADAGKQKELDAKYQAAISKGDGAMSSKDYTSAKTAYTEASGLKPAEAYPKTKLAEIDKLLADAGKQKELDAKYQDAIKRGDASFGSKDYTSAKTAYTEASSLKSSESYPKTKLAEIDKLLGDAAKQKEMDAKYQAAITKGDGSFTSKDYSTARSAYSEASGIKPAESYPKTKLAEIDKLLGAAEAEKQKEQQYKNAIAKADAAFGSKDYLTAKSSYSEASGIKPAEAHPKNRLSEIDKLLADAGKQKELDAKYQAAISKGDGAMGSKDYTSAKTAYTEATGLKPSEAYPKNKLTEIDKLIAEAAKQKSAAEQEKMYKDVVARGDRSFGSKDYESARSAYTEASGIKPLEAYPKTKLAELDKLMAAAGKQAETEAKYKDAIRRADGAFGTKDYSTAKAAYTEASGIKPAESYPKTQLAEIDKLLAAASNANAENEKDTRYKATIAKGDKSFAAKDYVTAKAMYTEATRIKPVEAYPKDKLAEIAALEKAIADANEQKEIDAQYKGAVARGDKSFIQKDYNGAKLAYEEALTYKPDEKYPQDRIKLINDIIQKQLTAQAAKKEPKKPVAVTTPVKQVTEEEKVKQYMDELRAKYPKGVTEEEYNNNGKIILRRVVIRDDYAGVYTKVTHNWGGVYCFKDNTPITEVVFENESK